jgi:hypothetical protein
MCLNRAWRCWEYRYLIECKKGRRQTADGKKKYTKYKIPGTQLPGIFIFGLLYSFLPFAFCRLPFKFLPAFSVPVSGF